MIRLEKQLTPADRKWFDDLRMYVTLGAFLRDETAVDVQLYAMMTDLLSEAQHGGNAANLFGDDPKLMADSLLKELPRVKRRDLWKLLIGLIGLVWLVMLIGGGFGSGVMTINVLSYLGVSALTMLMVGGVFWALRNRIYTTVKLLHTRIVGFLVMWLILMIYTGGSLAMAIWMPPVLTFQIIFPWDLAIVGVATAFAMGLALHQHDRVFTPMAFMAGVIGGMTMLRLFWNANHFIPRWILTAIVVVIALVSMISYTIWMRHVAKHLDD